MIHPATVVRWTSKEVGRGVYATSHIPLGTIVYAWDPLEIEIPPDDPRLAMPELAESIERYSYVDSRGHRIVSWDNAKYVNHSCRPNSMSTGYGFEIAIRDIQKGEEITDEYGLFNLPAPVAVSCCGRDCRATVGAGDLQRFHVEWDETVRRALRSLHDVTQPLWPLLDRDTRLALSCLASDPSAYVSVRALGLRTEAAHDLDRSA
jgi:hypothetical protein